MSSSVSHDLNMPWSVSQLSPRAVGTATKLQVMIAWSLLVVLTPLWLVIAILLVLGSRGPLLVPEPVIGTDGRLTYRTAFRTSHRFSAGAHDRAAREPYRFGRLLRHTGLARLPWLLDIKSTA